MMLPSLGDLSREDSSVICFKFLREFYNFGYHENKHIKEDVTCGRKMYYDNDRHENVFRV